MNIGFYPTGNMGELLVCSYDNKPAICRLGLPCTSVLTEKHVVSLFTLSSFQPHIYLFQNYSQFMKETQLGVITRLI